MNTGKDSTDEYSIPDDLFLSREIILEQIEIIENLFPRCNVSVAKKQKLNADQSTTNKVKLPNTEDKNCRAKSPINGVESSRVKSPIEDTVVIELDSDTEPCDTANNSRPKDKSPIKVATPKKLLTPKLTANQLKQSLKETLEKVSQGTKETPASGQVDQLAEYRIRQKNRTELPAISSPSTSLQAKQIEKENSGVDQLAEYRRSHQQKNLEKKIAVPSTSAKSLTSHQASNNPSQTVRPDAQSSTTTTSVNKVTKNINDYISVVNPKGKKYCIYRQEKNIFKYFLGQMAAKLAAAAPYNFFLTTITDSKLTHKEPLSITLQGKLYFYFSGVLLEVICNSCWRFVNNHFQNVS